MKEIIYKCACMKEERTLHVRYRGATEDIVHWMQAVVQPAITNDHRQHAPLCTRTEMEYAKIELDRDRPIGIKPTLN